MTKEFKKLPILKISDESNDSERKFIPMQHVRGILLEIELSLRENRDNQKTIDLVKKLQEEVNK